MILYKFVSFHLAIVECLSWHGVHTTRLQDSTAYPSLHPAVVLPYDNSFASYGQSTATDTKTKPQESGTFCGPSADHNTMQCFFVHGTRVTYARSYPMLGMLAATPLFYQDTWIFSTAHGFLLRVKADPKTHLPLIDKPFLALWGSRSRGFESSLRPKTVYSDSGVSGTKPPEVNTHISSHTLWLVPSSSPFVGRVVIQGGSLYVVSANQYLQALDLDTGKLQWSIRLSTDASLQLRSNSLMALPGQIVIGTNTGSLISLDPATGRMLSRTAVQSASNKEREQEQLPAAPDRFLSVAAQPLVLPDRWVVSNADSVTEAVTPGLEEHKLLWRYPMGSVVSPLLLPQSDLIVLGGSRGRVVALHKNNGAVAWKVPTLWAKGDGILTMVLIPEGILVASFRGALALLNPISGQLVASRQPLGQLTGAFFLTDKGLPCLGFMDESVRCYKIKSEIQKF